MRTLATLACLILLAGCSSSTPAAKTTAPAVKTTTTTTTTAPVASTACLDYPLTRAQSILEPGMTASKASAVKSPDHAKVYYVAVRFSGAGVSSAIGIWATNDLTGGAIYSVDGYAKQFSSFPSQASLSQTDTAAVAAKGCLG